MVNKIALAFVAADGLFAVGGAIMLAFSVIVQQTCFNPPTEGVEAARDLLYREFPFNGECLRSKDSCWLQGEGVFNASEDDSC